MRLATFVIGLVVATTGGAAEVSDAGGVSSTRVPVFVAPMADNLGMRDAPLRSGVIGAMGLVPAQHPSSFALPISNPLAAPANRYNPANIPLPVERTLEDHVLTGFVALMLIAYQLRRKHRFLRPHRFNA